MSSYDRGQEGLNQIQAHVTVYHPNVDFKSVDLAPVLDNFMQVCIVTKVKLLQFTNLAYVLVEHYFGGVDENTRAAELNRVTQFYRIHGL